MAQQTLTHKDLGEALGVSVTTVKSYRRKFPGFIPVAGYGKPIRFQPRALDVCRKIRECFEQGLSVTETEKRLRKAGFRPEGGSRESSPEAAGTMPKGADVSPEYLEKFFKTAGQMMQGMAQLATAQARAETRLSKLEDALHGLLEAEAGSQELLGRLAAGMQGKDVSPSVPTAEPESEALETSSGAAASEMDAPGEQPDPSEDAGQATTGERRVRATKIVNVRGRHGVERYSLENAEDAAAADTTGATETGDTPDTTEASSPLPNAPRSGLVTQPPQEFLEMPVAIRSEQGEFLGLPGRLSLGDFTKFLVRMERESGPVHTSWNGVEKTWTLRIRAAGNNRRELGFAKHTTRRGVDLAVLLHLNTNGAVASHDELMDFFRETKDLIHEMG